jgi:hypothetical protein
MAGGSRVPDGNESRLRVEPSGLLATRRMADLGAEATNGNKDQPVRLRSAQPHSRQVVEHIPCGSFRDWGRGFPIHSEGPSYRVCRYVFSVAKLEGGVKSGCFPERFSMISEP